MKRVSDRLYAITTGGCMGLFLIYLFLSSDMVRADDEIPDTVDGQVIELSSICVAAYSILSVSADDGNYEEASLYFTSQGNWWGGFLVEYMDMNRELALELVNTQSMLLLNGDYELANLDYEEYKKIIAICLDMKIELGAILDSE